MAALIVVDNSLHQPADGASLISQTDGLWGTLGCLVKLRGEVFVLGSAHVMIGGGAAAGGAPIFQPPSRFANARVIATVAEGAPLHKHTGEAFSAGAAINTLDAALARVIDRAQVSAKISDRLLFPNGFRPTPLAEGDYVQVWGAASGYSRRRVIAINHSDSVCYHEQCDEFGGSCSCDLRGEFRGLVLCGRYGIDGDSGAAVLDENYALAGIHLADGPLGSVFCPIQAVRDRWPDLELVTSD